MTNHAPAFRIGAFARLHEREDIVVLLVGGDVRHGGGAGAATVIAAEPSRAGGSGSTVTGFESAPPESSGSAVTGSEPPASESSGSTVAASEPPAPRSPCSTIEALPFPALRVPQRGVFRLAASGRFRAVVAGLSGRVAVPAAYAGARAGRVPFVLWATIWRHPRSAAHALSYLPLRHIYRHADAIATYGPHVSDYVRGKGASGAVVEAPQSVDDAFWSAPAEPRRLAPFQVLFAGRPDPEKGLDVLLDAWRATALPAGEAVLVLAGGDHAKGGENRAAGPYTVHEAGSLTAPELRNFYAGSDVVVVPSVPTATFLEPWGLVVNEAFDRGVPVIATTAVGAVAGGLVQHERTGLVVPPGDPAALAAALRRLHAEPDLRARLGAAARTAVRAYSHDAWAAGMSAALAAAGAGRPSTDAGRSSSQGGGSSPEGC